MPSYPLTCKTCGKNFTHHNKTDINRGLMNHCSNECKNRKYKLDENYFKMPLTDEKLFTLGQFIVCAELVDWRIIKLFSTLEILTDINLKLGSTYPIVKSDKGLWKLIIRSDKMVSDLIELGLYGPPLSQEVPSYDIIAGMFGTHCYSRDGDVNIFRTVRSKVALYVADRFGGKMVSNTYKDVFKGVMGCEWVVVWK